MWKASAYSVAVTFSTIDPAILSMLCRTTCETGSEVAVLTVCSVSNHDTTPLQLCGTGQEIVKYYIPCTQPSRSQLIVVRLGLVGDSEEQLRSFTASSVERGSIFSSYRELMRGSVINVEAAVQNLRLS